MSVRYLVDTDWAIHYLNGNPGIVTRLNELQPNGLGLSIVSLAELYEGIYYSKDPLGNEHDLQSFLQGVTVLGIDDEICKIFGKERGRLRAKRKVVGDFDLLIGSTARRHHLVLLTNNRRHFEMIEGLQLSAL